MSYEIQSHVNNFTGDLNGCGFVIIHYSKLNKYKLLINLKLIHKLLNKILI